MSAAKKPPLDLKAVAVAERLLALKSEVWEADAETPCPGVEKQPRAGRVYGAPMVWASSGAFIRGDMRKG